MVFQHLVGCLFHLKGVILEKITTITLFDTAGPREGDLREHIPVPYDSFLKSILSFAPRCES